MNPQAVAAIAVDWGTSQLRLWPLAKDGSAISVHRSPDGMRTVANKEFEATLNENLNKLDAPSSVPIIMCGMVGSRQGWQEAPYVSVPCSIDAAASGAVQVKTADRDIRILPGLAIRDAESADVMRSEETQLLGLFDLYGPQENAMVCMPGTHAKWVLLKGSHVEDFATSLSGELFASLGSSSVLKHALANAKGKIDPKNAHFLNAVVASLREPATILNRLFSARSKSLLLDLSADDAAAFVSGTIIGQDIAGGLTRFPPTDKVTLVGSGHLGALYQSALTVAGLKTNLVDGDELAIAGLAHAARLNWPERFAVQQKMGAVS